MPRLDRRALLGLTGLAALSSFTTACDRADGIPPDSPAGVPTNPPASANPSLAPRSIDDQVAAVRNGDRSGYVDAVGVVTAAGRRQAEAVFTTITELGAPGYRMATTSPGTATESLTVALPHELSVTWSFRVPKDPSALPPDAAFWRSGGAAPAVLRTDHTVVLSPPAVSADIARVAEESVERVLRVWPDAPTRVGFAVVVARDAAALAALAAPGRAVATSTRIGGPGPLTIVLAPDIPGAAVRIRASVLTHETVHVVGDLLARRAGAEADRAPRWLREGLAEFVSADTLGLTDAIRSATRASVTSLRRPPTSWPDAKAFASADSDRAYDLSWLAVSLLVERLGIAGVITWYERWSRPGSRVGQWPAGVDRSRLETQFRRRLSDWRR